MDNKRFALLIDADNISYNYISTIIDETANEGILTYKRIYGDWTSPCVQPWKSVLLEYSITPIQQYSYTTGKNSTDSAMIIDAMDILYAGKVDGFFIASSDSDFTRLATRLRESGMIVIGMGEKKTPRPFVSACNKFKYLEVLSDENSVDTKQNKSIKKSAQAKETNNKPKTNDKQTIEEADSIDLSTPEVKIKESIIKIINENSDDDGYMLVSNLGNILQKMYPDFDPRNFGQSKLTDLLAKWRFEIKPVQDSNNVANPLCKIVYIKIAK